MSLFGQFFLLLVRVLSSLALILLVDVRPGLAVTPTAEEESLQQLVLKRPKAREHLLGRGHIWIKFNQADFDSDIKDAWGVDTEGYVGLEGYWWVRRNGYIGVEIGRIGVGSAVTEDGDRIEDFDFTNLEINTKRLYDLTRGLSLGFGIGVGGFWANGEEVRGQVRTDLADFGFGVQGFVEINWRARKFVAGIDVKYQVVSDILDIDYSNFRWGGHLGVVF